MRILIFGTVYAGNTTNQMIAGLWRTLHSRINPECDLLLVDSDSPLPLPSDIEVLQLGDNIGHLARGGQDGWGRAWCAGLKYAMDNGYDYVVHIEGDSLFRLPVLPIIMKMHKEGSRVLSVPVKGTRAPMEAWLETGLMFMSTNHLKAFRILFQYNWQNSIGKKFPKTPERHLWEIFMPSVQFMPWRAERNDNRQINLDNVKEYDWITHVPVNIAAAFVAGVQ